MLYDYRIKGHLSYGHHLHNVIAVKPFNLHERSEVISMYDKGYKDGVKAAFDIALVSEQRYKDKIQ